MQIAECLLEACFEFQRSYLYIINIYDKTYFGEQIQTHKVRVY